jgi:putative tryptophan/tyrosine transport system substrate-binding protein
LCATIPAFLADFTLKHRIASIFAWREWVAAGGLISYGLSFSSIARRVADYVDRIAKGVMPADLPVEQPTKFELIINLKTAKALDIQVPDRFLAIVDGVIE